MSARDLGNETAFPGPVVTGQAELLQRVVVRAEGARRCAESIFAISSNGKPAAGAAEVLLAKLDSVISAAHIAATATDSERGLAELSWNDIHRAMRSYGHTATQEAMRRALVSFLIKRDVHGLHPFTVADGHRPIEGRP